MACRGWWVGAQVAWIGAQFSVVCSGELWDLREFGGKRPRQEELRLATRAARLGEFITDALPEAGMLVELLCEDHVGTYLLPFLCRSIPEGFRNEQTGELVTGSVVGWRDQARQPEASAGVVTLGLIWSAGARDTSSDLSSCSNVRIGSAGMIVEIECL